MEKIRIILADDHPLIREGFRSLLSTEPAFDLVGEAEHGNDLLGQIDKLKPDVVLTDIRMPQLGGLDVLEQLRERGQNIKCIILTMHEEREYVMRAIRAGAKGYLLKNVERADLVRAINTIYQGGTYFSPLVTNILAESIRKDEPPPGELTPRELEVLKLVASGQSTKQVADELQISNRTVESHRINMLKKMQVSNTAELIKRCIDLGILS